MTDLETLLRETLHARADQAPLEHRVIARSLSGPAQPTAGRVRRLAAAAATVGIAATVITGFSVSRHGDTPTAIDGSTGAASQTTPAPSPSEDLTPSPDYRTPTLALNEYTNAVTEKIVECLQDKGFAVVMNKESQMSDGAGRAQLTWRVPPALQNDQDYQAAAQTCTAAAGAAVPPPPS